MHVKGQLLQQRIEGQVSKGSQEEGIVSHKLGGLPGMAE